MTSSHLRHPSKTSAQAGFTLTEVLVAMVIFAISGLAVTQLVLGSTLMVSRNNKLSHAVALAQRQIEELRTLPYADIPDSGTVDQVEPFKETTFAVSWLAETDPNNPDMKTVTITVTWQEKGVAQNYETQSIYTNVTA